MLNRKEVVEWLKRACLKADRLLTRQRVRNYSIVILYTFLVIYAIAVFTGDPPFYVFGRPLAVDLTAHVTAGRIALEGNLEITGIQ